MTEQKQQILRCIEKNPMIVSQAAADPLHITPSPKADRLTDPVKKEHAAEKNAASDQKRYAAAVGGVNIDIGGRAFKKLIPEDSNPGAVSMSLGGVGRNIAHNLRLLGENVCMLTAYGNDFYGQKIVSACSQLGIDLSHALCLSEGRTSTYLYIAGPEGDMSVAVSDMEICKKITPSYLAENLSLLNHAAAVITDANLPEESLAYLAENCTVPLFCDPVSTSKAEKLLPVLSHIHTIKPNLIEARLLSGITIQNMEDVQKAADILLKKGVQRVFISMGADGVYAADRQTHLHLKNLPGKMVNTTGCGDAFMGALVWAYMQNFSLKQSALAGLAAASIAIESEDTISPDMSAALLKQRMAQT